MIAVMRSTVFALVFWTGSVPLVLGAALAVLISPEAIRVASKFWARWFVWTARVFAGVRLRVEGVVPQSGVLVAIKHQAAYETYLTLHLFDNPAVVMKVELRRIPFWGLAAERHGSIFADRQAGAGALRVMLRAGEAAKAAGRPVVIFPEGTRVPPGASPPLQPGFAGLYRMLKLPVVPAALDSGRCWPKGFIKHAGTVTVRFGETIPPGLPREDIEARVHAAINALN